MLALVTGGGGFLGRYIVELLVARGDRVRSLSRRTYAFLDELGVKQYQGNIDDRDAVERAVSGVEVVFHTAAIAGIGGRWRDFYATNVTGTENVIHACREHLVERLVYTSSPS